MVLTDEAKGYIGLQGAYDHYAVNHSAGEYVRLYFIHTNGLENAWSLFKRQVYGIHHWISDKHLDRYLGEFTYRFNRRETGEGARVNDFLGRIEGRLTYKMLIA
ncbi:MAG TPA: IS1595 family transposase [Acetobacteraceae bacterium]|nr:IS1595 family transposase [Acetobacteraceae bacterium]